MPSEKGNTLAYFSKPGEGTKIRDYLKVKTHEVCQG
jgi:hypothetical protein